MKNLPFHLYYQYQSTEGQRKGQAAMNTFLELMEIQDFQPPRTEEEFQNSPLKKALESLRINGKPMFGQENNPVTTSNYKNQVRDAMDQITSALLNPVPSKVPYVQSKVENHFSGRPADGPCQAIIPEIPRQPVQVPEKPAWYKRFFKAIVPSWRQEVNTYQEAKLQEERRQFLSSIIPVLEERAAKRSLQSAVQESRSVHAPCNQEIENFFGKKKDQIIPSKLNGKGFTNIGRENVPMAFALGIMMAEKGIGFDEALRLPNEEKQIYGEKALTVFADFKRIGESMYRVLHDKVTPEKLPGKSPYPLSDDEQRMYVQALGDEFKEKVAPYMAKAAAAFGSQSILPVDSNNLESVRETGQRNQMLTSLGQGLVQMYRNSLSPTDPARLPFLYLYGQEILNESSKSAGKINSNPLEQAFQAFASPDQASQAELDGASRRSTVADPVAAVFMGEHAAENKKALDSAQYSFIVLDGITRANSLSNLPLEERSFNSVIDGTIYTRSDEIVFGTDTMQTVFTKNAGLQTMPESLRSQYSAPFYKDAYQRKENYDLFVGRYQPLDFETMDSMAFSRLLKNSGKQPPETLGFQERDDRDKLEKIRQLGGYEGHQQPASPSRQQISLHQLAREESHPSRRSPAPHSREHVPAPAKDRSQLKQPLL